MIKKLLITLVIILSAQSVYAEILINTESALKKTFELSTRYESKFIKFNEDEINQIEDIADIEIGISHRPELTMYTVYQDNTIIGYAFEDIVIGKWGPIHYLAALNSDATIRDVMILDFHEIRGRKVAKKRFLRQYKGKSVKDPIRVRKDIDGVSGATITSRSLTDGIRKIVYIFDRFIDK